MAETICRKHRADYVDKCIFGWQKCWKWCVSVCVYWFSWLDGWLVGCVWKWQWQYSVVGWSVDAVWLTAVQEDVALDCRGGLLVVFVRYMEVWNRFKGASYLPTIQRIAAYILDPALSVKSKYGCLCMCTRMYVFTVAEKLFGVWSCMAFYGQGQRQHDDDHKRRRRRRHRDNG